MFPANTVRKVGLPAEVETRADPGSFLTGSDDMEAAAVSDRYLYQGEPAVGVIDMEGCSPAPGVLHVRVAGELDIHTAPWIRSRILERLENAESLIVNLMAVEFLSSAGVEALLDIQAATTRAGMPWQVVATTRAVLRPLEVTGVRAGLPLVESVDLTVRGLGNPEPTEV